MGFLVSVNTGDTEQASNCQRGYQGFGAKSSFIHWALLFVYKRPARNQTITKHRLLDHLSKLTLEQAKNSLSIDKRNLQAERAGHLQSCGIGSSRTKHLPR
jgi:hypothetical protein